MLRCLCSEFLGDALNKEFSENKTFLSSLIRQKGDSPASLEFLS